MCAQVIHSCAHSLWGQVQNASGRCVQGFQAVLESFLLDLDTGVCRPMGSGGKRTMAPGQSFRPLRPSFQSLITDLSTAHPCYLPRQSPCNKKVDIPGVGLRKRACSKNHQPAVSLTVKGKNRVTPLLKKAALHEKNVLSSLGEPQSQALKSILQQLFKAPN